MDTESRLLEIERQLEILRDHEHNGVDFKLVSSSSSSSATARLVMANTQAINDSSATLVNFDTESFSSGITVNTTNKSLTIVTTGKYLITAQIMFSATVASKSYYILVYKNGSAAGPTGYMPSTNSTIKNVAPSIVDVMNLAAGDVITIYALQFSGGTETITNDAIAGLDNPSFFSMCKV